MTTSSSSAPPPIEPEAAYRVVLTRSVPVGRTMVHPDQNPKMNGETLVATLAAYPDAVASYEMI